MKVKKYYPANKVNLQSYTKSVYTRNQDKISELRKRFSQRKDKKEVYLKRWY